jgi:hypothetical protein
MLIRHQGTFPNTGARGGGFLPLVVGRPWRAYAETVIIVVFAMAAVGGTAVTLLVLVLRLHAAVAVYVALVSSLAVTGLVIHQATQADGIPPTRYDRIVIAIGTGLGALLPALLLAFLRWLTRFVEAEGRLAAEDCLSAADYPRRAGPFRE